MLKTEDWSGGAVRLSKNFCGREIVFDLFYATWKRCKEYYEKLFAGFLIFLKTLQGSLKKCDTFIRVGGLVLKKRKHAQVIM